jgi:hypothetical protein
MRQQVLGARTSPGEPDIHAIRVFVQMWCGPTFDIGATPYASS